VAEFVFATCLPGLEAAVKREVARTRPDLKFAYSRPGLITFKSPREVSPDDPPGAVFARVWGRSVGAAREVETARSLLGTVDRIHVWSRDPDAALPPAWAALDGGAAIAGELIGDVIVGDDARADASRGEVATTAWLGVHRHDARRSPLAGGGTPAVVPADAPSRAYAKIEEAIAFASLPVGRGHVALEIGAAPGGAVMALAQRGVEVWAVDTGNLAPQVLALPGVHHLEKKVGAVRWEELPPRIDWLLLDVNLAPQVALHEIARLMPRLRDTLRGAVLTLKLNDDSFVDELPKLRARIHEIGFASVVFRHLPSNRREICVIATSRTT
jgi:23S rRNA (cytidine2498-2'-O)-methyltransferase